MDKIDIKISQINKQEFKDLQSGQLTLALSGKTVNATLVNTLRRLTMDYIPTYAFHSGLITIEKNTSIFNNDYMKLRLSQLTIPNLHVPVTFLEDKYWKDVDFRNPEREKHPNDNKMIEIYLNVTNKTDSIMNVTTEHLKIFEDGTEIKDKFDANFPLLIIQLRPGEVFSCRCVGVLAIGMVNNIWAGAGQSYLKEINDNEYHLIVESQGQMDEYELLHKSCEIIKEKIKITRKMINTKYNIGLAQDATLIKLEFENEDHTLCGLINEYLQENKNVLFSGVSKPNPLIDIMKIVFQTLRNNPFQFLDETLDFIVELFDNIQSQLEKLGGSFIKYNKTNKNKSKK